MSQPYRSIADVEGREPVGAVLTIGVKALSLSDADPLFQTNPKLKGKDSPVYADRFWIVSPYENERRVRPPLAEFKRFNGAAPAARSVVHGNFVHATIAEAFEYRLQAQKLPRPNPNPPGMRPTCSGDGVRATRFVGTGDGGAERWDEIACPHRLCEFRQGTPAPCKPFSRLYFRPSWLHYVDKDFHGPTPLLKWSTGSWNNVANLIGFFGHISTQAEQLGIIPAREDASAPFNPATPIYGLPFSLILGRKTQPQHGRAFPVVAISPEVDLIAFFLAQKQRLAELGEGRPLLQLVAGAQSPEESSPAAVNADFRQITPGVPGSVVEPPEESMASAVTVGSADWIAEQCEQKVEAIEAELRRLHPGDDRGSERARENARGRMFGGARTRMLLSQLSLDALIDGLDRLRAEAKVETV